MPGPEGQAATIRPCRGAERQALLSIINAAAERYRGVIPDDCWHDPYMSVAELTGQLEAGVQFWGAELDGTLLGVMGIQHVGDVDLIRHAYVAPEAQGQGLGGSLLAHLTASTERPILIGTWAAASWAIAFYERHGFKLVERDKVPDLLRKYWAISERQIETSVVLRQS
jgi:N-acetylglutamate synthase-like GNAT family acetyltransferase